METFKSPTKLLLNNNRNFPPYFCSGNEDGNSDPPRQSDVQLIPIYTDWANRYLAKAKLEPIRELTKDLRDPKTLIKLLNAITSDCVGASSANLLCAFNATLPHDIVDKCLQYLACLGVNVAGIQSRDIIDGDLGTILSLLYALSHFKQQQKSLQFSQPSSNSGCGGGGNGVSSFQSHSGTTDTASVASPHAVSDSSNAVRASVISRSRGIPRRSMPPNNSSTRIASALRTPQVVALPSSTSSNLSTASVGGKSRLAPPSTPTSRISVLAAPEPTTKGSSSAVSVSTSRLPSVSPVPSAGSSRLKPPIGGAKAVNTPIKSFSSSNDSVASGSSPTGTYISLHSARAPAVSASIGKAALKPPTATVVAGSKLAVPTAVKVPASSKMLKLFGKDKTRRSEGTPTPTTSANLSTNISGTQTVKPKTATLKGPGVGPTKSEKTGLRPPAVCSGTTSSGIATSTVISGLRKPSSLPTGALNNNGNSNNIKRNSKSSEEDSAYAGFGSQSPMSSSTGSSLFTGKANDSADVSVTCGSSQTTLTGTGRKSVQTTSSTHSPSNNLDDSGVHSDSTNLSHSPTKIATAALASDPKPVLAVKGVSATSGKSGLKPPTSLPVAGGKAREDVNATTMSLAAGTNGTARVTVGVVSPMRSRIATPSVSVSGELDKKPREVVKAETEVAMRSVSNKKSTVPTAASEVVDEVVPMKPIRLAEMPVRTSRMSSTLETIPGGASDDSLDSVSTAIHCVANAVAAAASRPSEARKRRSGCVSEGESLAAFPDTPTKSNGYASEGMAIYGRRIGTASTSSTLRHTHNSYDVMGNRGRRYDFNDSFEDSSSISSGISENFDDISTDDLTGSSLSDFPMAAAAAPKFTAASDYHPLAFRQGKRAVEQAPAASASSAVYANAHLLRYANLNGHGSNNGNGNVTGPPTSALTSNGNSGSQRLYHTLVPKLALSEDGDTLSISRNAGGRSSLRYTPSANKVVNGYSHPHQHTASHSANSSPYHSHSLDRHGHLKIFADSSAPSSPYRLSVASSHQATHSPRTSGLSSEGYASGRQSVAGSFSARSESSDVYANYSGLNLHKLSNTNGTRSSPLCKASPRLPQGGSEMSLASTATWSDDRYQLEIQKLNQELLEYRDKLSKMSYKEENYQQMIQAFEVRLQSFVQHAKRMHQKDQKRDEELEQLRAQVRSRQECREGAGELMRHPSMESVTSHRSSLSTSSKSSKAEKGFGKNPKKSWIRSSFSRAFHKNKKNKNGSTSDAEHSPLHATNQPSVASSTSQLEAVGLAPEVLHLRKELKSKEEVLADIRLDALDKAREVDALRETVARLANENKLLKRNCNLLARRMDSRTSSRQSLSTCQDEDPVYDPLPTAGGSSSSHMSERSFSSTSSKRSSGGLATKVCISLEPNGTLEFTQHQSQLTLGSLAPPTATTTWEDVDAQLMAMFREYLCRIERDSTLGIDVEKAIVGYRVGTTFVRNKNCPDLLSPTVTPADLISPSTTILIRLQGVSQQAVDGLIVESLFPKAILDQLIRLLEQSRRLVIHGARGIGKSNLAKTLAKYFSLKLGCNGKPESIVDVRYPDDDKDPKFQQVQGNLQSLLRTGTQSILLIDNVQRKCIPHLLKAFQAAEPGRESPFVICTVNGAMQRQVEEMQTNHGFRIFHLSNHMDAVKGFMGRYLRRRIAEAELTGVCRCGDQLQAVIDFLGKALLAINAFIEKANAHDETIGPRTFVQCPLSIEASRDWFVRLWNENLVPYMIRAATDGMVIGCRGSLRDPTEFVLEHWPWPDNGESALLKRVVVENGSTSVDIDPILALERIEENRKLHEPSG